VPSMLSLGDGEASDMSSFMDQSVRLCSWSGGAEVDTFDQD